MPRTSRELNIFPIALRTVEVRAVEDITPHMRRITVGGPDMAAGVHDGYEIPAFRSEGFDDHVKLVIPQADGDFGTVGVQDGDRFDWERGVLVRTRDYTVRRVREDEFDIDFVVHDGGVAAEWAKAAQVGDPLKFAGPKVSASVNPDVDWHLLIADETALPAVGRWLEEAPEGVRAFVVVEVPSADDVQQIDTSADAEITWLIRPEGVAPGYSTQLLEAVRALDLPAGRGFAWCAGETLTISPIRRHLRGERGLPKEDVEVVGYWRRTSREPETDARSAHAPADGPGTPSAPRSPAGADAPAAPSASSSPAAPSPQELAAEIHEMSELLPPIVLRVAVTLRVPELIAGGTGAPDDLARATGVPIDRLLPLLQAMQAIDLVIAHEGELRLTALGEVLLEASAQEDLHLDDPVNRLELGLVGLLDALRTGEAGGSSAPALPLSAWKERDAGLRAALHDRAEAELAYSLQALAEIPVLAAARTIVLLGDGLVPTAHELLRAAEGPGSADGRAADGRAADGRAADGAADAAADGAVDGAAGRRIVLAVPEADVDLHRDRIRQLPPLQQERIDVQRVDPLAPQLPEADALLVQLSLDTAPDAVVEAVASAAPDGLVIVTDLSDEAAEDDHAAARSLVALSTGGTALRTGARWSELLRAAGFTEAAAQPLGWGFGPSVVVGSR